MKEILVILLIFDIEMLEYFFGDFFECYFVFEKKW